MIRRRGFTRCGAEWMEL